MAQAGIPTLLALEVARGQASVDDRPTYPDRRDGAREPDLGPSSGCLRARSQAGYFDIAPNCAHALARGFGFAALSKDVFATLDYFCPQPRPSDRGMRLRGGTYSSLRISYVFVVMEVGSRNRLHVNATPHPTASWTLQQFREAIPSDHTYRWLLHDRSGTFSGDLDRAIKVMGVAVLKTPIRSPKASAYCERLIGSFVVDNKTSLLLRSPLCGVEAGAPPLAFLALSLSAT